MVYVDDIKMSCPPGGLKTAWSLIKKGIETDDPNEVDKRLGCKHRLRTGVLKPKAGAAVNGVPAKGVQVNMMELEEKDFMASCVDAYKNTCGEPDMKLRHADSPFISSPDGGV